MFALCDGDGRARARRRAGLQAGLRRRRGPEHRRHGLVRARRRASTAGSRLVATCVPPVLAELARRGTPFVGTLFAGLDAHGRTGRGCSSTTAASAIPRRSPCCRSSTATCSRRSPRPRQAAPWPAVALALGAGRAVTVVLAAGDYPAAGDRGTPIEGVERRRGAGRARLPRRHGAARRPARDERRPAARRHRDRRDARGGPRRAYAAADSIRIAGARRRATSRSAAAAAAEAVSRLGGSASGALRPTTHCQFYRPIGQRW